MQRGIGAAWAVRAQQPREVPSGETADPGPPSLLPAAVTLRQNKASGLASPAPCERPHTRPRRLRSSCSWPNPAREKGTGKVGRSPVAALCPRAPAALNQQNCGLGYGEVSVQPRKRPLGQRLECRRISWLTHRGSGAVVSWVILDPYSSSPWDWALGFGHIFPYPLLASDDHLMS